LRARVGGLSEKARFSPAISTPAAACFSPAPLCASDEQQRARSIPIAGLTFALVLDERAWRRAAGCIFQREWTTPASLRAAHRGALRIASAVAFILAFA